MKRAIIRQRVIVAKAWERAEIARTPRAARRQVAAYYEARRRLINLRIASWHMLEDPRDTGRCPQCHETISLSEAENYR